jgi:hypothetical protein
MAKVKLSAFDRLRLGARLNRKDRRDVEQRLSDADPGLEIVNRDAAGIDVGNESHYVAVPRGRDAQPVREFGSWTAALVEMAQWLVRCGIRTVVMQSTGVYWIAVHDVLQKHGLEVNLVDARGTKNVPGRKSDAQECQWLMRLHTYGDDMKKMGAPDTALGHVGTNRSSMSDGAIDHRLPSQVGHAFSMRSVAEFHSLPNHRGSQCNHQAQLGH